MNDGPDIALVRAELRSTLEAHGYRLASDTLGARGELYIMGANDLARALFEFKSGVAEAIESMYQGSWAGLPPRFAVLPAARADDPSFELLEQMHIVPLLYRAEAGDVEFIELDRLLSDHLRPEASL